MKYKSVNLGRDISFMPLLIWFLSLCFLLKSIVPPRVQVPLILQGQPQPSSFPFLIETWVNKVIFSLFRSFNIMVLKVGFPGRPPSLPGTLSEIYLGPQFQPDWNRNSKGGGGREGQWAVMYQALHMALLSGSGSQPKLHVIITLDTF